MSAHASKGIRFVPKMPQLLGHAPSGLPRPTMVVGADWPLWPSRQLGATRSPPGLDSGRLLVVAEHQRAQACRPQINVLHDLSRKNVHCDAKSNCLLSHLERRQHRRGQGLAEAPALGGRSVRQARRLRNRRELLRRGGFWRRALDARPGFADALKRIAANGVRTIIVETASRFARDLIVAETGFRRLRDARITLIAADAPSSFLDNTPTSAFIRQVLAAVQELDKAMIVSKLKGARQRKRSTGVYRRQGRGAKELPPGRSGYGRSR
jgi:Resolvase, N terminal domain